MLARASRIFIAWAVLAACGGGSGVKAPAEPAQPATPEPAPASGASGASGAEVSCQQAIDHAFAVIVPPGEPPDVVARSKKVFLNRCDADRWSAEFRACLLRAKQPDDGDTCEELLTPEQKEALLDELARELDAAGVPPEVQSGKPPAPEPAQAPREGGAKRLEATEKAKEKKSDGARPKAKAAPRAAPKPGARAPAAASPPSGGEHDPCEGGE